MKSLIKNILLILFTVGLIYFIFFNKPDPVPIPDPEIKWKTDTVWVDKEYEPEEDYGDTVKPRYITKYITDSSALDSLKLILQDKEITIEGLKEQISIHQNFIKNYPKNPKLIELGLTYDTLSLSLLHIDGNIVKNDYPIFTDFYRYKWVNDNFSKTEHRKPQPNIKKPFDSHLELGYDFLFTSPYIAGEISKSLVYKFDIYGRLGLGLLNKESSEIKVGIKYNLTNGEK